MKIEIDVKSNGVPVTTLDPGTVFQYDKDYGVRIHNGWIVFTKDNEAIAYIDSEESESGYKSVIPRPELKTKITIS